MKYTAIFLWCFGQAVGSQVVQILVNVCVSQPVFCNAWEEQDSGVIELVLSAVTYSVSAHMSTTSYCLWTRFPLNWINRIQPEYRGLEGTCFFMYLLHGLWEAHHFNKHLSHIKLHGKNNTNGKTVGPSLTRKKNNLIVCLCEELK